MLAKWKKRLHTLILVFIVAGIAFGALLNYLQVPTELGPGFKATFGFYTFGLMDMVSKMFMSALKMVIIPVVITSIAFGLGGMSKGANVGRIASRTLLYYFATTAIAVCIGLFMVKTFAPGENAGVIETVAKMVEAGGDASSGELAGKVAKAQAQLADEGLAGLDGVALMFMKLKNLAVTLIPGNAIKAMADGQFLPLIVFSILLGVSLLYVREKTPILLKFFEQLQELFFALLGGIMVAAPIGFFAIVGSLCWTVGLDGVGTIWVYAAAVVLGLAVHGLIVLPAMCYFIGGRNPWKFAKQIRQALVMAFSTASSSATLPVTLQVLEEKAEVSRDYTSFVLPLGATVNMDGTAIYESIALVTLVQAYAAATGIDLQMSMIDLTIIFITVTLAAIGAAGVPGAGIFMLIMLLSTVRVGDQVGVPAHLIGLILVLDRPLDMLRTCINVWGDSVGCAVVSNLEEKSLKKDTPNDPEEPEEAAEAA